MQVKKEGMKGQESAQLTFSKRHVLSGLPGELKTGAQENKGVNEGHVGRLCSSCFLCELKPHFKVRLPRPLALDGPC